MTHEAALDVLKEAAVRLANLREHEILYRAICVAIPAVEKQIPMEHHHTKICTTIGEKVRVSVCPSCLGCIITLAEEFPSSCTCCGQALDWGDKNG